MPSIFSCHDSTIDVTSSTARIVPHFAQRDVWDCGIACVAMICGYICPRLFPRETAYQRVRTALDHFGMHHSNGLWTIHLVVLLHKLLHKDTSVNVLFSSTVLGVNQDHANIGYYSPTIHNETLEVEALFQEAKSLPDMTLRQEKLDIRSMISVLSNPHEEVVFLCLVDCRLLKCKCLPASNSGTNSSGLMNALQSTFQFVTTSLRSSAATSPTTTTAAKRQSELDEHPSLNADSTSVPILPATAANASEGYLGHYVVVVGYHAPSEQVLYRNPRVGDQVEGEGWLCAESIHTFEAARAAVGTDYDTVMVAIPRLEGSGLEEDFGVL